jgi:hypothetical protein
LPRNAAGLSAAQCGGLVDEMARVQFATPPDGGKPIMFLSECESPDSVMRAFSGDALKRFRRHTGVGAVIATEEVVVIGAAADDGYVDAPESYVYRPVVFPDNSATRACDGTCTYGAGCACEDGKHNA